MIVIECSNIKQVIVKTLLLQLQDKIIKHYYIFDCVNVHSWHSKQLYYGSYCIINPRLMVFKNRPSYIMIKAIPEESNEVFYNNFSESSAHFFKITLS
ncbi:MAG: hypothetical protein VZS44_08660 [Bacilli bacterium]|nr:hypothetical protein [Bacilli bacterium]